MILGMTVSAFTQLHVIISLIGIATGFVVAFGLATGRPLSSVWTALFLITTVLTSASGFLFHSKAIGPPHIVGVISLVVLAVAIYALYARHLAGAWRKIYIVTALLSLYLNVFVGLIQAFQKVPALHQFAPKGSEPPFAIAQLAVVALFVWLGFVSFRRLHASTIAFAKGIATQ
jgi:hypothetical protein